MFWTAEELEELGGTTVRGKSHCILVLVWYSGRYYREDRQRGGREGLPGEAPTSHTSEYQRCVHRLSLRLGIEQHGYIQA